MTVANSSNQLEDTRERRTETGEGIWGVGMGYFRMGLSGACLDADERNSQAMNSQTEKEDNGNVALLRRLEPRHREQSNFAERQTSIPSCLEGEGAWGCCGLVIGAGGRERGNPPGGSVFLGEVKETSAKSKRWDQASKC